MGMLWLTVLGAPRTAVGSIRGANALTSKLPCKARTIVVRLLDRNNQAAERTVIVAFFRCYRRCRGGAPGWGDCGFDGICVLGDNIDVEFPGFSVSHPIWLAVLA